MSWALACCAGWTGGTGLPEPGKPHPHWAAGHSRACVVKSVLPSTETPPGPLSHASGTPVQAHGPRRGGVGCVSQEHARPLALHSGVRAPHREGEHLGPTHWATSKQRPGLQPQPPLRPALPPPPPLQVAVQTHWSTGGQIIFLIRLWCFVLFYFFKNVPGLVFFFFNFPIIMLEVRNIY